MNLPIAFFLYVVALLILLSGGYLCIVFFEFCTFLEYRWRRRRVIEWMVAQPDGSTRQPSFQRRLRAFLSAANRAWLCNPTWVDGDEWRLFKSFAPRCTSSGVFFRASARSLLYVWTHPHLEDNMRASPYGFSIALND